METNVKNNNSGVAAVNPVKADKVAKFVAGNPINAVRTSLIPSSPIY
ncbi:MAG: hypothetical protein V4687_13745 [Bacteroidota bacterium]